MIITCEQCKARYLLASLLLGAEGRKVCCGVCGHTWYQEQVDEVYQPPAGASVEESISFQDHLDAEVMESIPQGVKPIPDGSSVPSVPGKKPPFVWPREAINGIAAAACVILLLAGALVLFRSPVVHAWAPSALLFEMAGLSTPVPGEGLIFDQVKAKAVPDTKGVYTLSVEGNIINLTAKSTTLPKIRATLRESETQAGDSWIVTMDKNSVGAEETISFTTTLPNLPEAMKEVNIRFVLE